MAAARITLREAPHKRAPMERRMRYDVLLDGALFSELYFNMGGYQATNGIPYPKDDGSIVGMHVGEIGIGAYRREIAAANRALLARAR